MALRKSKQRAIGVRTGKSASAAKVISSRTAPRTVKNPDPVTKKKKTAVSASVRSQKSETMPRRKAETAIKAAAGRLTSRVVKKKTASKTQGAASLTRRTMLQPSKDDLRKKIDRQKATIDKLRAESKNRKAEHESTLEELEYLRSAHAELEESYSSEISGGELAVEKWKVAKADLNRTIMDLRTKIRDMEASPSQNIQREDEQEEQLTRLKNAVVAKNERIKEMEKEIASLKKQISSSSMSD